MAAVSDAGAPSSASGSNGRGAADRSQDRKARAKFPARTTCENGLAAIELARQKKPDIILLDVMMPGIDGPTTIRRIQADPDIAHIPVVLVTARVQAHEKSRYLDLGATGIIPKPFDPMTLHREISAFWNRAAAG